MKTIPFDEMCRKAMSPRRMARIDARAERDYRKMVLRDLRKTLGITQKQLAAALGLAQSGLSELEHREDYQLATLRRVVQALGGELDVIARFPDRIVALKVA